MFKRFLAFAAQIVPKRELPGQIDVRRLMEQYTVEEFNEATDQYFQRHTSNAAFYLKKPLGQTEESVHQLIAFAELLNGLKPLPGMCLLDFGAGACWTSRYFADFNLKVVACDVSPAALDIGRQRFARHPVINSPFKPEFLVFNGRRLELPDESVDRIASFDAFNHVPNPREVLHELARVLKPQGIAGFSEPGPFHSLTAQSQFEMKNYRRVENDIILEELWPWANEAGFTDIRVAVFNPAPFTLSFGEFKTLLKTGFNHPLRTYAKHVHRQLATRRIFFLYKGEPGRTDSRDRIGLACEMDVELKDSRFRPMGWIEGRAIVRNSGEGSWLPSTSLFGPVKLGVHLKSSDGQPLNHDYCRANLPLERGAEPGETVEILFRFKAPLQSGDYILEFDMVSEEVCWFEANGSKPVASPIKVE